MFQLNVGGGQGVGNGITLNIPSIFNSAEMRSQQRGRRIEKRCSECTEEDLEGYDKPSRNDKHCSVCGSVLIDVEVGVGVDDHIDDTGEMDIFEILGQDLRAAIEASMSQAAPGRSISLSFLETLGKVVLDKKKTLLFDTCLQFGPLKVMAVPASFQNLPFQGTSGELVICRSEFGEDLTREEASGKIICVKRGKISFARKANNAQKAGAVGLVIFQTADIFPFVMSDSAGELTTEESEALNLPIVMISIKDSELIQKMLRDLSVTSDAGKSCSESTSNTSSETPGTSTTTSINKLVSATLSCAAIENSSNVECAICQEVYEEGCTVLKLPCRHCYHVDCVSNWLTSHSNTCPLCRTQFPDGPPKKQSSSRRDEGNQSNIYRQPYFN